MGALTLIAASLLGSYYLYGLRRNVEWHESTPLEHYKPTDTVSAMYDLCGRSESIDTYVTNMWAIRDHKQGVGEGVKPVGQWPMKVKPKPTPAVAEACQRTVKAVAQLLDAPVKSATVTPITKKPRTK